MITLVYRRVEGAAPGINRFVCPELEADALGGSVSGRIWFRDPLGTNAKMLRVTIEEISAENLAALKSPEEPTGEGAATDGEKGSEVPPQPGTSTVPEGSSPEVPSTVPEGSSPEVPSTVPEGSSPTA